MDEGSRTTGLTPRLTPRTVATANGGLHAISLLTKERVQRFARQQCNRAHADFVEHAKHFGRVLGEHLTAEQAIRLREKNQGLSPGQALRVGESHPDQRVDGRARLLESLLIDALKSAEDVARSARRMGDATLLFEIRSQMVVLSYSAASLRSGGACTGLYERTLVALDRVEQLAGFRERPKAGRPATSAPVGH